MSNALHLNALTSEDMVEATADTVFRFMVFVVGLELCIIGLMMGSRRGLLLLG